MSLRDDLDYIDSKTIKVVDAAQWNAALDRLRAALTPAALKWLEALPELLKLDDKAYSGPWAMDDYICVPGDTPHQFHIFAYFEDDPPLMSSGMAGEGDARLIVKLRNALHEAAALHAAASAVNAGTDNKEQK